MEKSHTGFASTMASFTKRPTRNQNLIKSHENLNTKRYLKMPSCLKSDNSVRFDLKTGRDKGNMKSPVFDQPHGMKIPTQFSP